MALRYIESISSMSAESLNSLRKNFTKLMKTGLELEVFTALVNKNLTDFIYEAMLKSGQAEKEAKYIEGNAQIISGYVGIGLASLSFLAGAASEYKIHKNNRGLKRIQSIKSSISQNKGSAGIGEAPKVANPEMTLDNLKTKDLRTQKLAKPGKDRIGALGKTKYGKQATNILDKKQRQYEESKSRWSNFEGSLGNLLQTLSNSTSQIIQGGATIKAADKYYLKACYDAGIEVARNVSEGNRSIGQTEHEMAMRLYDLASGIDHITEDLDRHSVLRG